MSHRLAATNRIGLALSGGTLKATAHIGVLSALHAMGIYPDCVAGTSSGAFVAALYAHGYSPDELYGLIRRFPGPSLFDFGFPVTSSLYNLLWYRMRRTRPTKKTRLPAGLLRGDKLCRYFRHKFKGRQARMPYYITATDLVTGRPVTYSNDEQAIAAGWAETVRDPGLCIRGSCSLPGVFTPVKIGKRVLVDGAFRHYVPVEILRSAGCSKIIAVNLYALEPEWKPVTILHVLARSYDILLQESVEADIEGPGTIVLEPDVTHMSWLSFDAMASGVDVGKQVVLDNRDRILSLLTGASDDAAKQTRPLPAVKIGGQPLTRKPPKDWGATEHSFRL